MTSTIAPAVAGNRTSPRSDSVLTDEMLKRFASRSATYDRENAFFAEDFEELRAAGYLTLAVPSELDGRGFSLADVVREQRRLGYHAPATALAINMHLYWTGVAADLWRAGDKSLQWLLEETARGAVFAAGHAESGNDIPVLLSTTKAERVDGGYRFTGRKSFGSLTPVWTFLGLHGMDASNPSGPKVVHAFMPRDTKGYRVEDTWDVLGMRATRSDDTILEGVFVPDRYIGRVVPAGAAGIDHFILALFAWALLGFGNIYYGLARRARNNGHGDQIQALDRTVALDGLSRRASARRRRDDAGAGHDRAAPGASGGGVVVRRQPRRLVAERDLQRQIPRRRNVLEGGGSGPRRRGRLRNLPQERARTDLPRCTSRTNPPGELHAHA